MALKSLAPPVCQICKTGTRRWSECSEDPQDGFVWDSVPSIPKGNTSSKNWLRRHCFWEGNQSRDSSMKSWKPLAGPWFIWSFDCKTWLPPLWVFLLRILLHEETIGCCALVLKQVQFSSVAQSCQTLCDPMDCSTPGKLGSPFLALFPGKWLYFSPVK